ncbi:MAG: condensation domain-containing protein [Rhodococcus sp. (in: high G+C Gram-positive bacteria)]|nr:condensation domain-containing protein [Rhodococcus sp. (in: high G+C Gram-positive bacteria)]
MRQTRIRVVDASPSETTTLIEQLLDEQLDLAADFGMRFTIVASGDSGFVVFQRHHMVTDDRSNSILLRDLGALYRQELGLGRADLPELAVQYGDFAVWNRISLGTQADPQSQYRRELDYWNATLDGCPAETRLPLDADRSTVTTRTRRSVTLALSDNDSADVAKFLITSASTPLQAIIVAAALALWHEGAGTSIPIGSPIDLRDDPALADLIGYFINTVVIRTDLDEATGFGAALRRTRERVLDAQEHKHVPFDSVVDHVLTGRRSQASPLFQVMAVYTSADAHTPDTDRPFEIHDPWASDSEDDTVAALFDLVVGIEQRPDGRFAIGVDAVDGLFEVATVERLAHEIRAFLVWGSRYPDAPIPMLSRFASTDVPSAAVPCTTPGAVLRTALPSVDARRAELRRMSVDQVAVSLFGQDHYERLRIEDTGDQAWLVGFDVSEPHWLDAMAAVIEQLVDGYADGITLALSARETPPRDTDAPDDLSQLLDDPFWEDWVDSLADLDVADPRARDSSGPNRGAASARCRILSDVDEPSRTRAVLLAAVARAYADPDPDGALIVEFEESFAGGASTFLTAIDADVLALAADGDAAIVDRLVAAAEWDPRRKHEYELISASPTHRRFFDDLPDPAVTVSVRRTDCEAVELPNPAGANRIHVSLWVDRRTADDSVAVRVHVGVGDRLELDAEQLARGIAGVLEESGVALSGLNFESRLTAGRVDRISLPPAEVARIVQRYGTGVEILPLSPLQSGLLYHIIRAREADDHNAYISQISYDLTGDVDPDRMRSAIATALDRYPNVRAGFVSTADGEVQVIPSRTELPYRVVTARQWAEEHGSAAELLEAERDTPFDHERPPLLRFVLVELDSDLWTLCMTTEHILMDGWSLYAFLGEILDIYTDPGYADRVAPASFRDYLDWVAHRDHDVAAAAWSDYLADLAGPSIVWPGGGDLIGSRVDTADLHLDLDPAVARDVHEIAREVGVTVSTVLQASWAMTLGRLLGTSDVVIGNNVSGRPPELVDADRIIGLLFNTLPFRVRSSPFESAATMLRRVQAEQLDVMEHSYVALSDIQERAGSGALFDTLFVVQNFGYEDSGPGNSGAEEDTEIDVQSGSSTDATHYPLTFAVSPSAEDGNHAVHVRLSYRRDAFGDDDAQRVLGRYVSILTDMVSDTARPVSRISASLPGEEALVRVSGENRVVVDETVNDLLRRQVSRTPQATALVSGHREYSFAEFFARVNQYARLLLAHGVRPEHRVALLLPRDERMVISMFAVFAVGAAYVPIDAEHPDDRIDYMLGAAEPTVTLVTSRDRSRIGEVAGIVVDLDDAGVIADIDRRAPAAITDHERGGAIRPDNLAYVIFTSGSTGRPKGVAVGYRGLTNMYVNHVAKIFDRVVAHQGGRRMRIAHTTSFAFDASWEQLFWMLDGHTVDVIDEELRREPGRLLAYYDSARVDGFDVTPSYGQLLVDEGLLDRDRPSGRSVAAEAAGVVFVSLGGEAVPERLWQQLRNAPGVEAYNLYGPTEYTINALGADLADSATSSVGTPICNTRAYILDHSLQPTLPGVAGELYLAGSGVARGLLGYARCVGRALLRMSVGERSSDVSHRGSRAAHPRGDDRISRSRRRSGQDSRVPHRTERGRRCPRRRSVGRTRSGRGSSLAVRGRGAVRLRGSCAGHGGRSRRCARSRQGDSARLHGSLGTGCARVDSAHGQWKGRRACASRDRRCGRRPRRPRHRRRTSRRGCGSGSFGTGTDFDHREFLRVGRELTDRDASDRTIASRHRSRPPGEGHLRPADDRRDCEAAGGGFGRGAAVGGDHGAVASRYERQNPVLYSRVQRVRDHLLATARRRTVRVGSGGHAGSRPRRKSGRRRRFRCPVRCLRRCRPCSTAGRALRHSGLVLRRTPGFRRRPTIGRPRSRRRHVDDPRRRSHRRRKAARRIAARRRRNHARGCLGPRHGARHRRAGRVHGPIRAPGRGHRQHVARGDRHAQSRSETYVGDGGNAGRIHAEATYSRSIRRADAPGHRQCRQARRAFRSGGRDVA